MNTSQVADPLSPGSKLWAGSLDTEYYQGLNKLFTTPHVTTREGVTVQMLGVTQPVEQALILAHPDQARYAEETSRQLRHPVMTSGFAPVDFCQYYGYSMTIDYDHKHRWGTKAPRFLFMLYAHFALAEAAMFVTAPYRQVILDLIRYNHLDLHKRTQTQEQRGTYTTPIVPLQYCVVTLEGREYRPELCIVDTAALQGHLSYKALASNAGIALSTKDFMRDEGWITRMHEAYFTVPHEFDTYAGEDLHPYDILSRYAKNLGMAYENKGIGKYYRGEPRLTQGGTTKDFMEPCIYHACKIAHDDYDAQQDLCKTFLVHATAKTLVMDPTSTISLLAKAEGGRCRCNRCTAVYELGVLCDLDLKSCYGEGLRAQIFPVGRPLVFGYDINSKRNEMFTLRQFLREVGYNTRHNQLVYGLWHARVTLTNNYRLRYPQDVLASWTDYDLEDIREKLWHPLLADDDPQDIHLQVKSGRTHIFTHDIRNGVITSDYLDWLFHIASQKQRDELLDHLYVQAGMIYPACEKVDSYAELQAVEASQDTKNTRCLIFKRRKSGLQSNDQECHAWYGLPMDKLFVDYLLKERLANPKHVNKPLNELFKLLVNSAYGDMTSPFFEIGNMCVGNNITARARFAAYYMEKGLFSYQTITDGGVFNLNTVVYSRDGRRIAAHHFVKMYQETSLRYRNMRLAPLDGCSNIALHWEDNPNGDDPPRIPVLTLERQGTRKVLHGNEALAWINEKAMEHLQALFPHVTVLHQKSTKVTLDPNEPSDRTGLFSFEAKDLFCRAVFHGAANYMLWRDYGQPEMAIRSYEKNKRHIGITLNETGLHPTSTYETYTPGYMFLDSLQTPDAVPPGETFCKEAILKTKPWRNNQRAWSECPLVPGDGYYVTGLLRPSSLSQFTCETYAQEKDLDAQCIKYKRLYGHSMESLFLNSNGTYNITRMVQEVDQAISAGCHDLFAQIDPHDHRCRSGIEHQGWQALQAMKAYLKEWQGMHDGSDVDHDAINHALPRAEMCREDAAAD
jgi:hypothetical protein